MADPRTFVLIGDFQDNITPALEGINNSIARLKQTMSTMTSKRGGGFSDVTQSVGKLVSANKHLSNSIKEVGDAAKVATGELKEYKSMAGKVASAHYHIARAANQAGDKIAASNNRAVASIDRLDRRERLMASARRQRLRSLSSVSSGPRPARTRSTMPLASGGMPPARGGGSQIGGGGDFPMARFTLAFGLSEAISAPITSAITAGFQIGTDMMMKPFQYFMNGMQERMQDEMSDLKAAGGFFSINKASQKKFLETGSFQEAIDFMQENNTLMAKLAGSLPGSTQDFIEVNKRISDSIAALVTNAPERAMALAEKVRQEETSTAYSSIGPITGAATSQKMQDAMQILMADLTKQTVLAGQGTGGGRGGAMGAYGLPQLTERMLSQQDISMGQMQKYAAIFRDPMIMRNLEKELPKISATMANTPERYEALRSFFEKVLPPELVERYRRTLLGVQETFNTAIFSPETGIFGLGRRLKALGGKFDEYGRMLDKNGKVTQNLIEQARIDISIYDTFRDVLANVGRVLAPIAESLSLFWDPLRKVGELLEEARAVTYEVVRSFEIYVKSYEKFAKTLNSADLQRFSQTGGKELRASLATIANLMRSFGILSSTEFGDVMDSLAKVDMDGGQIFKGLLDKFLQSDIARQIGDFVGTLIGTVLVEVSQVTGFISGRIAGTGKLFDGLKAGFDRAGGPAAFGNIFKDVFKTMFNILGNILKVLPMEAYMLGAFMFVFPLAMQTLSMAFAHRFSDSFFDSIMSFIQGGKFNKCFASNRAIMSQICTNMASQGGGAAAAAAPKGRKGRRSGGFFIGSKGAKMAENQRKRFSQGTAGLRNYLTQPVVQGRRRIMPDDRSIKGPAPRVALGTEAVPFTPRQQIQRGAQSLYNAPGKFAKRVGAAPISPVMAAMGGMFKGGGGRALIRQRNIMGGAARGMAKMGRFVPGGALAFGGIDAAMRMASGEDAGKAIGGAAASTIGATLGGILGQTLIPIPGVGAALGTVAGGFLGDKIFTAMNPAANAQQEAARVQEQAARMQMEAAGMSDLSKRHGVNAQYEFGNIKEFTARLQAMGYGQNPLVQTMLKEYGERNVAREALRVADLALAEKEQQLKTAGITDPKEMDKFLQPLRDNAKTAAATLKTEQDQLNVAMKALPTKVTDAIITNVTKVSWEKVSEAVAQQIRTASIIGRMNARTSVPGTTDTSADKQPGTSNAFGSPGKGFSSLAGAINYENKHKPSGSKIVIANSSERIIPAAANGYIPSQSLYSRGYAGWDSSGELTVNAPITINGAGQNAEEIAIRVADLLGDAIETARSRSLFG